MKLSFTKMQGCANDYIYLTAVHPVCPQTLPRLHSGSLPGIFPWVQTASSASAPL